MVAMSSTVGKDEKSSGRSIHNASISTSTDRAIEAARPMSMRTVGTGRNRMARIATTPPANSISRPARPGVASGAGGTDGADGAVMPSG